ILPAFRAATRTCSATRRWGMSRAATGGPTQPCHAVWRNAWSIHLAGVRQSFQVRAGGTVRRGTMNEINNGCSGMPNDFSGVSVDEGDQIQGGRGGGSSWGGGGGGVRPLHPPYLNVGDWV